MDAMERVECSVVCIPRWKVRLSAAVKHCTRIRVDFVATLDGDDASE